ncbi:hypothetical protein, partial [Campylobacter jejuni]|uniref:hypothetical protein n=1 Tax=Campylobacter jejuni TaxID=197 RepID=UPI001E2EDF58
MDSTGQVKIVDYHQFPLVLPLLLDSEFNLKPSVAYWNGPEFSDSSLFADHTMSSSADIWSLGVWIMELAQGYTP